MYAEKLYAKMTNSIKSGRNFEGANRGVVQRGNEIKIFYYDTRVAVINKKDRTIQMFNRGWETVTTKETLNALLKMLDAGRIYQRDYVWYYELPNGETTKFYDGIVVNY